MASKIGTAGQHLAGQHLADATRDAFAAGLGDAMKAGAAIAIMTAAFTLWRAPRRSQLTGPGHDVAADKLALSMRDDIVAEYACRP